MKSHGAKIGLWLMLCLVASGLWFIGEAVVASIVSPWLIHVPPHEREFEYVTFDGEGVPIITGVDPATRRRVYRDLDGELLDLPEEKLPHFLKTTVFDLPDPDFPIRVNPINHDTPALPWSYFSIPLPWDVRLQHSSVYNGRDTQTWIFLSPDHPNGTGYFVVWNDSRSERIGYLGINGLTQTIPPPEQQFPAFGNTLDEMLRYVYESQSSRIRDPIINPSQFVGRSLFLISPARDRLFHIQLMGNTVRTIYFGPPGSLRDVLLRPESSRVAASPADGFERIGTGNARLSHPGAAMFLVMPDEIQHLDQDFQLVRRIRLPEELRGNRESLGWIERRPGEHIILALEGDQPTSRHKSRLFWFNDAGEVSQRREVWLHYARPRTLVENEMYMSVAVSVSPLASVGFFLESATELRLDADVGIAPEVPLPNRFSDGVRKAFAVLWLPLMLVLLASLGLAVASQRRLRRVGASRFDRVAWGVLILLFGIAGYWAFLVHRRWPMPAACPACGHDSPRDRGECLACGAEFAAPARNGCELFA